MLRNPRGQSWIEQSWTEQVEGQSECLFRRASSRSPALSPAGRGISRAPFQTGPLSSRLKPSVRKPKSHKNDGRPIFRVLRGKVGNDKAFLFFRRHPEAAESLAKPRIPNEEPAPSPPRGSLHFPQMACYAVQFEIILTPTNPRSMFSLPQKSDPGVSVKS